MAFANMTRTHLLKNVTTRFLCSYLKTHSEEMLVTTPIFSSYHENNISICISNYVTAKIGEDEKNSICSSYVVTQINKKSQELLISLIIYGNHTSKEGGGYNVKGY